MAANIYSKALNVQRLWIKNTPHIRFYHRQPKTENVCLVYFNSNDVDIEVRTIDAPRLDEALIQIDSNCVSPKDFDLWRSTRGTFLKNKHSLILGSSASGTIAQIGIGSTTDLKEGDRVVIEPGVCCLKCDYCLSGRTNLCSNITYAGSEDRDGTLAKYALHPTKFCHKIQQNVSFELATLVPYIAATVHCYERAKITPTTDLIIFGAGLMGLLSLITFKHFGVKTVFIADETNYRLDMAIKLGADYTLKLAPINSPEYPEYLKEISLALKAETDTIVDTFCTKYSIETAFQLNNRGGKIILMAFTSMPKAAPFMNTSLKEVDVIGSFSYTHSSFQKALTLVAEKSSTFSKLISLQVPFSRAIDAFSYIRATSKENLFFIVKNDIMEKEKQDEVFKHEEMGAIFKNKYSLGEAKESINQFPENKEPEVNNSIGLKSQKLQKENTESKAQENKTMENTDKNILNTSKKESEAKSPEENSTSKHASKNQNSNGNRNDEAKNEESMDRFDKNSPKKK